MRNRFNKTPPQKHDDDSWIGILWKPAAAVVYLLICIFDFVIVPTYLGLWAPKLHDIIFAIKDLPPDAQAAVLNLKLAAWEPLTLKGGGLFHVAFGAILGATVWSRGQERINEIKQGWGHNDYSQHDQSQYSQQYQPPQYPQYQQNQYDQSQQMQGMVTPTPMVVNNQVVNPAQGAQIDNPDENG